VSAGNKVLAAMAAGNPADKSLHASRYSLRLLRLAYRRT
jgi:hypothetical protein